VKMPGRRFFPFPRNLPPDIFGLKRLTALGEVCLTEDERQARRATIRDHLKRAFKNACRQLGEDDARSLFGEVMRKPKRGVMKTLARETMAAIE
jgi:hypothetical protein